MARCPFAFSLPSARRALPPRCHLAALCARPRGLVPRRPAGLEETAAAVGGFFSPRSGYEFAHVGKTRAFFLRPFFFKINQLEGGKTVGDKGWEGIWLHMFQRAQLRKNGGLQLDR